MAFQHRVGEVAVVPVPVIECQHDKSLREVAVDQAAVRLVQRDDLKRMKPGAVIVDVAIDQGGCIETSKPTTHRAPTYVVDDVVHYCVTNMPGAVGRTSTYALCNVTLPYALKLANAGWQAFAHQSTGMALAINLVNGQVTNQAVAETFNLPFVPWDKVA